MSDQRRDQIRHLAGRIAADICWPDPDTPTSTQHTATVHRLCTTDDIGTAIAALASAGSLIPTLTGTKPDLDTITDHLEATHTTGANPHGLDIAVGFTRHALTPSTAGAAVDFFFDAINATPDDQRTEVLHTALLTILRAYTVIAQAGHHHQRP